MKLIIELDEKQFKDIQRIASIQIRRKSLTCEQIIANGTPLPKGHGRLIDADKLVYDCSLGGGGCDHICRCDGCSYNIIREHTINEAPTIIEADKGE